MSRRRPPRTQPEPPTNPAATRIHEALANIRRDDQAVMSANTVVLWDNRSVPDRCGNTDRGLTHLARSRERQAPMKATQICSAEGCEHTDRIVRGLCGMHYSRLLRHCDPLYVKPKHIPDACSIDGCNNDAIARGWCGNHYYRWSQNGTTDLVGHRRPPPAIRLAAQLERKPNGCLEWTGYTDPKTGYGKISINNKRIYTHRLAWELAHGPIPDGLLIRHFVCDNPPCCDPEHLLPGTKADNHADMMAHGRRVDAQSPTHCPQGHEYAGDNLYLSPTGSRACKICRAAASARYLAKKAS